jgi:5'-deoxynucleotidase YfbR-like HD superfamily hydrolase
MPHYLLTQYVGQVDLENPANIEKIDIRDIGRGLSRICRWGGHTRAYFSVAEHCVLMSRRVMDMGGSKELALECLLHDASEAYIGDVVGPFKEMLGDAYLKWEDLWMSAIAARFSLSLDFWKKKFVRELDLHQMMVEKFTLIDSCDDPNQAPLLSVHSWDCDRAFKEFTDDFMKLTGK